MASLTAAANIDNRGNIDKFIKIDKAPFIKYSKVKGGFTMFSMDEIAARVGKSKQALYNLIKTNQDLSMLVKTNKVKSGQSVKYGLPVLEWFINHYQLNLITEDDAAEAVREPEPQEIPEPSAPGQTANAPELAALRQEVQRLTEENERLRAAYDKAEEERGELMKQNGILALTLQQVQQEKMLYLPAPKKPLGERVRDFIGQIRKSSV